MDATRWTWPDRIAVPTALAVAEASWATLVVDASLTRPRIHVSLLAFVLPAAVVIACAGLCSRMPARRSMRLAITAVASVVVISLAAGIIGVSLTRGGFATLAWHPWTIKGARPIECAWTAWPIAFVAGARGWWLGARPVSFRRAGASASVGVGVFVVLFIVDTLDPERQLHRALSSMGWSAVLFITCTMAGLVAIRRREIEGDARRQALALEPTARDLTGIGLVVGLTAAAVLLSVVLGFVAPDIAHAVVATIRAIGATIRWLVAHVPRGHPNPSSTSGKAGHQPKAKVPVATTTKPLAGSDFGIVFAALGVVALLAGIVGAIRLRLRFSRSRTTRIERADDTGESDSVFSWRHLFDQIRALLRRVLSRSRDVAVASVALDHDAAPNDESVRGQYRRLLAAAARHGRARRSNETATEFEHRLTGQLEDRASARADLADATRAYELVRYGEKDDGELITLVRAQVDRVVEVLGDPSAPDQRDDASSEPGRPPMRH